MGTIPESGSLLLSGEGGQIFSAPFYPEKIGVRAARGWQIAKLFNSHSLLMRRLDAKW